MQVDVGCCVCRETNDTILHVLRDCQWAVQAWSSESRTCTLHENGFQSFVEWASWVWCSFGSDTFTLFITVAWRIWHNRLKAVYESMCLSPSHAIPWSNEYIREFQSANSVVRSRPAVCTVWKAPPLGWFKLNCDGAVFEGGKASGAGAVVRDNSGCVVGAMSMKHQAVPDAATAEAWAIYFGMLFAKDAGFRDIIIESDCSVVITALQSNNSCFTSFGTLIDDVRLLRDHFNQCMFSHTKRQGSEVAHQLAKFAASLNEACTWFEEVPDFLFSAVQADFSSLMN